MGDGCSATRLEKTRLCRLALYFCHSTVRSRYSRMGLEPVILVRGKRARSCGDMTRFKNVGDHLRDADGERL